MPILKLTKQNFTQSIQDSEIVAVTFWPRWNHQCQEYMRAFLCVSEQVSDIVFAEVNICAAAEEQLAHALCLGYVPALMVFREGVIVFSQAGELTEPALIEILKKCIALDMKAVYAELTKCGGCKEFCVD